MGDNRAKDKDEDLLDKVERALGVEVDEEHDPAEAEQIRRFQPPNIPG